MDIKVDIDPDDAANGSEHCHNVSTDSLIIDDSTVEEDQEFSIHMLYSFPPVSIANDTPGIVVTIIDDDGRCG